MNFSNPGLGIVICIESLFLIYSVQRRGIDNRIHQAFKAYLLFATLSTFFQFQLAIDMTG